MNTLLFALFAVTAAIIVAGLTVLLQIGSSKILRFAEEHWGATGVAIVILSWFLLLPIMILSSIIIGLYLYLTVKPTYV